MIRFRLTVLLAMVTTAVVKSEPVGDCPPKDSWHHAEMLPDDKDCEMFYKCHSGFPSAIRCRYGLRFNVEHQVCDWPWNVPYTVTNFPCRSLHLDWGGEELREELDRLIAPKNPPDPYPTAPSGQTGNSELIPLKITFHEEETDAGSAPPATEQEVHDEEAARHFFELSDAVSELICDSEIHEHVFKANGKVRTNFDDVSERLLRITETVKRATGDAVVKYAGPSENTKASAGHTISNFLKNFDELAAYFDLTTGEDFDTVKMNENFQSSTNDSLKANNTASTLEIILKGMDIDENASNERNKTASSNDQREMQHTDDRITSEAGTEIRIGDILSMFADMKRVIHMNEPVPERTHQEVMKIPSIFHDTHGTDDSKRDTGSLENEEKNDSNYKFLMHNRQVNLGTDKPTRSKTSGEETELTKKRNTPFLENILTRLGINENDEANVESDKFSSEDKIINSEFDESQQNEPAGENSGEFFLEDRLRHFEDDEPTPNDAQNNKSAQENGEAMPLEGRMGNLEIRENYSKKAQETKTVAESSDTFSLEDRMGIFEKEEDDDDDEANCDDDAVKSEQSDDKEKTETHDEEDFEIVEKDPYFQIDSVRIENDPNSQNKEPLDGRWTEVVKELHSYEGPSIITHNKDTKKEELLPGAVPLSVKTIPDSEECDNSKDDNTGDEGNGSETEAIDDGAILPFVEKEPDFHKDSVRITNSQNNGIKDSLDEREADPSLTVVEEEPYFPSYTVGITNGKDSHRKVQNTESLTLDLSATTDEDDEGLISQGTERSVTDKTVLVTYNLTTQKITQAHSNANTTLISQAYSTDSITTPRYEHEEVDTLPGEDHPQTMLSTLVNSKTEPSTEPSSTFFSNEETLTPLNKQTTDYNSITQNPTVVEVTDSNLITENPKSQRCNMDCDESSNTHQVVTTGQPTTPVYQDEEFSSPPGVDYPKTTSYTSMETKIVPSTEPPSTFIPNEGTFPPSTPLQSDWKDASIDFLTKSPIVLDTTDNSLIKEMPTSLSDDKSSNTLGLSMTPVYQEDDLSSTPGEEYLQTMSTTFVNSKIEPTTQTPHNSINNETAFPPLNELTTDTDYVTTEFIPMSITLVNSKIEPTTQTPHNSINNEITFPPLNELTTDTNYVTTEIISTEGNSNTKSPTEFESTIFTPITENTRSLPEETGLGSTKYDKMPNNPGLSTTPVYLDQDLIPLPGEDCQHCTTQITTENPADMTSVFDDTSVPPPDEELSAINLEDKSGSNNHLHSSDEHFTTPYHSGTTDNPLTTSQRDTEPNPTDQETELPGGSTNDYSDLKTTNSIEGITTDAPFSTTMSDLLTGAVDSTTPALETVTMEASSASFADGYCFSRSWNPFPKNLAHLTDCGLYFHCVAGRPMLRHCPKGLHFSRYSGRCDRPHRARCVPHYPDKDLGWVCPPMTKADPRCGDCRQQGRQLPHPDNCSRYLSCQRGTIKVHRCRYGMHFNSMTAMCDFPFRACCSHVSRSRPMCKTKRNLLET